MSRKSCTWMLVCFMAACASSGQRARTVTKPPAGQAITSLDALTASVRQLSTTREDPSHRDIVGVLHQLARVIAALPSPAQGASVEATADRLAASDHDSNTHVELVQRALRTSQRALDRRSKAAGPAALRALAGADAAIAALDPTRPLLQQRASVVDAFQALTNALARAQDTDPPFPPVGRDLPPDPRTPEVALADARKHVLALARADLTKGPRAAGQVIADLAAIAASYGPAVAEHAAQLRFHAQRLTRTRGGVLDEARWIREALATAVEALEAGRDVPTRDARDAIAGIHDGSSVAFQRATIQDAMRATVGAFVAAEAPRPTATAERAR